MTIGDIRFAMPLALIALLLVPLVGGVMWRAARRRAAEGARYGGSPGLRLGVAPGWRTARAAMVLGALTLLIVAVARPQWGFELAEAEQRGIDIAVVLDVSRSMTATDVAPSRARAAATGLRSMLGHLDGNRVALVTFAGTAFTRSPLTVDLPAVANLVDRAQGDSPLVQAGTDLRVAIDSAVMLLAVADRANTQVILLISDGEDLGADVQSAIDRANSQKIAIYTVFAATEAPTALPASSGGTDVTRGDPRTLAAIARGTGGTTRNVPQLAGLAVDFSRMRQSQFDTASTRAPRDRFSWFVGGALALLLAQAALPASGEASLLGRLAVPRSLRARRSAAGVALSTLVLLLTACIGGTPAYREVEAGNRHYEAGRFDDALEAYLSASTMAPNDMGIQYNIANTLHRIARHDEALATIDLALGQHPEASLSTRLQYSAGNAALTKNDLTRARASFQQALRQDSTDRDAKANLELVLRRLPTPTPTPPPSGQQGQQGQQQQPGQQGQQPGQGDGQGQQQGQQGQQAQPGSGQQPGGGGPQGQTPPSGTPNGERASAEAQAAANAALEAALAELGPEVSPQEAARILELAQQANDLSGLTPRGPRGGVPAR